MNIVAPGSDLELLKRMLEKVDAEIKVVESIPFDGFFIIDIESNGGTVHMVFMADGQLHDVLSY